MGLNRFFFGAVRTGSKDKDLKKTLLKYFETAEITSLRNQDRSDRNQDQSGRNQDWSDRSKDRLSRSRYDSCSGKNREILCGSVHVCKKIQTACASGACQSFVEQAPTLPTIKEFPPRDLLESFEAVFVGIDPQDLRKKQTFPRGNLQKSRCRDWLDGETPDVFQNTFIDAPVDELDEEEIEELAGTEKSNKYRGPVDSTLLVKPTFLHSSIDCCHAGAITGLACL